MSDLCKVTTKLGLDDPDMDVQGYDLETARTLIHGVSRLEWEEKFLYAEHNHVTFVAITEMRFVCRQRI